jgi:diguanylate cyclase (GGDEF)-like protein/PAS domain S-box-containing protein
MNDANTKAPANTAELLALGLTLAKCLSEFHLQRSFHGCINPVTLGLATKDGQVGVADLLASAGGEQSLTYIAPEQTGRIASECDARTDLYALGIVLYELATGKVPFQRDDPIQLIHCHVAQPPIPPHELQGDLPVEVSDVILRLLKKHPDDRYQSCIGLIGDLSYCADYFASTKTIPKFTLGLHDFKARLRSSGALLGREQELQRLYQAYGRTAAGTNELVLVAGRSGVGKSRLVNDVAPLVESAGGIYLSGKFDQYKRNIPYATLVQAFQEFVRRLLAGPDSTMYEWRSAIQDAVGSHGRLLTDVIPELRHVLGTQPPPLVTLDPSGAENRFLTVFRRFVRVFATSKHPLVLFLDDLQWIDAGSAKLIEDLTTRTDIRHLMIIGAYRDDEVNAEHLLTKCVQTIQGQHGKVGAITLAGLSFEHCSELIAHVLGCRTDDVTPLASLLHTKTDGNPFFLIQFLTTLLSSDALEPDLRTLAWKWDLEKIEKLGLQHNVIDLMAATLQRLPGAAIELIKTLSCLGTASKLSTIQCALGREYADLFALLGQLEASGLVRRLDEQIVFAHDRVHEAAYSLIPEPEREFRHLQIARRLIEQTPPAMLEQAAFDLAFHFNRGSRLIVDPLERNGIFHINHVAGRRAKAAAAFQAARDYFEKSIQFLSPDAWINYYGDVLDLYLDCAECESVLGNFERTEQLLDQALHHVQSRYDQARIARVRIRMYHFSARGKDCLKIGLETLTLFGVTFPDSDQALELFTQEGMRQIDRHVAQHGAASLFELPVAANQDAVVAIGMLADLLTIAYSTRPAIALPLLVKGIQLSLEHGNIEESCVLYNNYALLLAGRYGNPDSAYAFSELALKLNERFNDSRLRGRLLFIYGYAFAHLRQPIQQCLGILKDAFAACNDVGHVGFAGASIDAFVWMAWESGMPLSKITEIAAPYREFSRLTNTFAANCVIAMVDIMIAQLQGQPTSDKEKEFVDSLGEPGWNYTLGHYHITRQIRHYIFGEYDKALEAADAAAIMLASLHALSSITTHHFYHALSLAAAYENSLPEQRRDWLKAIKSKAALLGKLAQNHAENFGCRSHLIEAEIARLEGRNEEATVLYESAIALARRSNQVQHEALAHELAGRFFQSRNQSMTAYAHFAVASACWLRWGASGKVAQLAQSVPNLASDLPWLQPEATATSKPYLTDLDALAVAKASQAVSSEIELGRLTQSLLRTVLEHAGADRGILILATGIDYRVEAEAIAEQGELKVSLVQSTVTEAVLPRTVFQYVTRTCEKILLDDASKPHPYSDDHYLNTHQPKSVLCLPLMKQAKLMGVLYLENRQACTVFTQKRIAMLELLAAQAVISLENANLYSALDRENTERKRVESALQVKTQELEAQAAFMNTVVENIPVAVYVKDARNELRYSLWNKAAEKIFRVPKHKALGRRVEEVWPDNIAQQIDATDSTILAGKSRVDISEQRFYDGHEQELLLHTIKVAIAHREDGEIDYLLGISDDITERKRSESLIWQQANFDSLTGLPNRSHFRDRLLRAMTQCQADGSKCALLFIDLDRFKDVNDSLGHASGDMLLVAAARRIADCVRESDTVARLGGDEFTVVLSTIEYPSHIEDISQRIIDSLAVPFQLGQDQAYVSASIGITVFPDDATEIDELMKRADQALYIAKDSGRNQFGYFTPAMQIAALHRMRLTADLRFALEREQLRIHFQPIVTLATGKVEKAEALLRWNHPELGIIDPAEFIPLAESSGLIVQFGDWVFHKVANVLQKWRSLYNPNFQISINQSPLEFQHPNNRYAEWLEYMQELGVPGHGLVLEITEGLLLDVSESVTDKLLKLRDAGVQVALDDFGTGYSSLAYLQKFDIDYLKIDRAFTQQLSVGSDNLVLCEAMIMMAHKLGLKVIAEGIESQEQHLLLRAAGCDYDQGFLFSRPIVEADFEAILQSENSPAAAGLHCNGSV